MYKSSNIQNKDKNIELNLNIKHLYFRRTKIIATIGPATSSEKMIKKLISKGIDIVRINFSHGSLEQHQKTLNLIRKICQKLKKDISILGDLCGPKIRVGEFENGSILLKEGDVVTLITKNIIGSKNLIPFRHREIIKDIKIGDSILFDDGNLEVKVINKNKNKLTAKVIRGGLLKNKKGMNLPDTNINIKALTQKDKNDALFCIKNNIDFIALSFVQKPDDIYELKRFLNKNKSDIPVIAKIEKPSALKNIEEILNASDGIMIARGDLGVEMPVNKLPLIQNKLIQIANKYNKPVIVATQMLESMIEHSKPTRAEVTDIAGACLFGADAVMLSGETAVGKYPIEAVEIMDSILRETEAYQFFSQHGKFNKPAISQTNDLMDAIGDATSQLSRDLMVHCIFVFTESGYTARMISSDRPAAPVLAITPLKKIAGRMRILWGVYPVFINKKLNTSQYLMYGEKLIKKIKLAKKGDYVMMVSGLADIGKKITAIMVHKIN